MSDSGDPEQDAAREREQWEEHFCRCWAGHGDCRGCSGYPGILHEPACGWEWNPACPAHAAAVPE